MQWQNLLFFTCPLLSCVSVHANAPQDTILYRFPATVVTASRHPRPLALTSENVAVIALDELTRVPARNLLEALSFVPGLCVHQNGGLGTRGTVSIQGSESRHVTVAWDGIPLNDLAEGAADLVQLPLGQAGRVEVVKGAASSAWGSALGGVIQIFSPAVPGEPGIRMRADAAYGTWGTQQHSLDLQGGTGQTGYLLTASHTSTDGFRPRSAHAGTQLLGKVEKSWREGRVGASYGHLVGDTQDFVQYGGTAWRRHEYTTRFGQVYYQGPLRAEADACLRLFGVARQEDVEFLSVEGDQVLQHAVRDEPIWGTSLQVTGPSTRHGRLAAGSDLRWSRADFRFVGGPPERRFNQQGGYVHWGTEVSLLALNAGLRYDRHSLYGSQWSPAAGVVYQLDVGRSLVRAHVARGFGAPPLAAAFYPETETTAPNPALRSERVTCYHVGIETNPWLPLRLRVSGFRSNVRDGIDSALNSDGKRIQKNFARVRRQGAEAEAALVLGRGWKITGGIALNDVHTNDDAHAKSRIAGEMFVSG